MLICPIRLRGHPPVGATLAVALVGRPCGRSWVSSAVSSGAPACRGDPCGRPCWSPVRSAMGFIGGTCGVILGTRKGCPYRVAHGIAVARAVGHGCHLRCHRGHLRCYRGHPQGVPLQGRPWVAVVRTVGHGSSGAPAVSFWAPARGAPTGSPVRSLLHVGANNSLIG
jgi:hypothetical protein